MVRSHLKLYLEINSSNFIFFVIKNDKQENFNIEHKLVIPITGLDNNRICDYDKFYSLIKENIYLIEQKLNYTFKEVILILESFNPLFINLSGFKKLNGTQILRENITYILNSIKSYVSENETKKTILHIFNSKFNLDNKKIENLPIGLFGDFYSHELSFSLINSNDFKNLENIFNNCNLKIKRILLKSFIEGANTCDNIKNTETFFQIKVNKNKSKIFFFENSSLKFEQEFQFGTDIIIKDVSKVTSLKTETVEKILNNINLNVEKLEEDLIEKKLFNDEAYRKIRKKLIYEIILARVKEISEILIFKNSNIKYFSKISNAVFLEINNSFNLENTKKIYESTFSIQGCSKVVFLNNLYDEDILKTAQKIVHFGWKKEAIPLSVAKKSILVKFFEAIFR